MEDFCDSPNDSVTTIFKRNTLSLDHAGRSSTDCIKSLKSSGECRLNRVQSKTPNLTQFRQVLGDQRVNSDVDRVGRAGTSAGRTLRRLFYSLCLQNRAARWVMATTSQRMVDWRRFRDSRKALGLSKTCNL